MNSNLVLWNIEQINTYIKNGCKIIKIDKEFSERLGKVGVYCVFEVDDNLVEIHNKWMSRTR